MKKIIIIGVLILALAIGSAFVYADSSSYDKNWRNDRMEYRRDELKNAVKDGLINDEDAKTWEEHFDYMDEFHKENHNNFGWKRGHSRGNRMNGRKGCMGRHSMGW